MMDDICIVDKQVQSKELKTQPVALLADASEGRLMHVRAEEMV